MLEAAALWMLRIERKAHGNEPAEVARILELAMAGDSAAFEQILRLYERRVLVAQQQLGARSTAEEPRFSAVGASGVITGES